MITSIHQVSYFPWLGLLNKINESDLFILLDDTQFSDRGFQNRNIFLDKNLQEHILTIPVIKKNYRQKSIKDIEIVDNRWQKKHQKFLMRNYNKHPFYEEIFDEIDFIYQKNYHFVFDILLDSMMVDFKLLNINTKIILQSDINYDIENKKSDLILALLKNTNSKHYLSGNGAKAYQIDKEFRDNNIELSYQKFDLKQYEQYKNSSFKSGLSSLDLLFNVGKDAAKKYI